MFSMFLFFIAIVFTVGHLTFRREWHSGRVIEVFLSYILLFNVGMMGLTAAYMHVFWGPETARQIGWQPGSPFQFEIGMANLSYGILGVIAFWMRGRFWDAVLLGWSILLLGCFVGHIMDYYAHDNTAPWNIGAFIWFNDLFLPFLVLFLLGHLRKGTQPGFGVKE